MEFSLFGIPYVSSCKTPTSVLTRPNPPRRRDLGSLSRLVRSERRVVLFEGLFDRLWDASTTCCHKPTFSGRLWWSYFFNLFYHLLISIFFLFWNINRWAVLTFYSLTTVLVVIFQTGECQSSLIFVIRLCLIDPGTVNQSASRRGRTAERPSQPSAPLLLPHPTPPVYNPRPRSRTPQETQCLRQKCRDKENKLAPPTFWRHYSPCRPALISAASSTPPSTRCVSAGCSLAPSTPIPATTTARTTRWVAGRNIYWRSI